MITYKLKINLQSEREMYSDMVFTTGDKSGYVLEFSFYDNGTAMNLSGCGLTVKSKRADGAVVIDGGTINGNLAQYTVADNACEVAGELAMEVALVRADGSCATTKVIYARVREGFGEEGLTSADNEPILARLEARAVSLVGAMNALETSFSVHKSDSTAHEEAFAEERKNFNPLYCNALKGAQEGTNITVSDAVEGTPLSLSLYGKCTETLANPDEEKSPDNPATITGIGESGSVAVRVTDADGAEKAIEIPLEKPLYSPGYMWDHELKQLYDYHDILLGNTLIRRSARREFDGTENWYVNGEDNDKLIRYFLGDFPAIQLGGPQTNICSHFRYNDDSSSNWFIENVAVLYTFARSTGWFGVCVAKDRFPTVEAFKEWLAEQKAAGTPVCVIYPIDTDISDTEAGQALLALTAQNGMTITNSEGAEMKAEYNRDINKAFEELAAAVVASV